MFSYLYSSLLGKLTDTGFSDEGTISTPNVMEYGFRTTDAIDVKAGDTLYIGVGNAAWPGSYPAETVYRVHVMENDVQLGDVNFDGKLDIADATLIQFASIDLEPFSTLQKSLADYNADGRVSILDTTAIQHKIAD